jgi:uncharacterized membrane protein
MTVSGNNSPPGEGAIQPTRRFSWLKAALIASLALNLLFVGGAVTRFAMHGPPDRFTGSSQVQLIPRKFFGELDGSRKTELLAVFREFGKDFRGGRKAVRDEALNLAAALETEPYDPARVKAVVDAFSARSSNLVDKGGEAALTLIAKLSPEERKLLAQHIRLRGEGGRRGERMGEGS